MRGVDGGKVCIFPCVCVCVCVGVRLHKRHCVCVCVSGQVCTQRGVGAQNTCQRSHPPLLQRFPLSWLQPGISDDSKEKVFMVPGLKTMALIHLPTSDITSGSGHHTQM